MVVLGIGNKQSDKQTNEEKKQTNRQTNKQTKGNVGEKKPSDSYDGDWVKYPCLGQLIIASPTGWDQGPFENFLLKGRTGPTLHDKG